MKVTAALAALTALVAGVPVVLIAMEGVPLPRGGVAPLGRVLSTSPAGDSREATRWIALAALVLAWSVWAWLTLCVVVEVRAWATGRAPARIPASRTAQSVVAFLVGTTMAFTAAGRGTYLPQQRSSMTPAPQSPVAGAAPSVGDGREMVTMAELLGLADGPHQGESGRSAAGEGSWDRSSVALLADGPCWSDESPAAGDSPPSVADAPPVGGKQAPAAAVALDPLAVPRTHLVRGRETLWSIAEDELGTALRWQELAQLNYGVAQEDGGALDESHWIRAGWRLLLPPLLPPAGPTTPPHSPGTAATDPGPKEADPATAGDARTADALAGPADGPAAAGPAPSRPALPPHLLMANESFGGSSPSGLEAAPRPARPPALPPAPPVVPLGAGVVGAGVARLIDRMRQVQQRHRPEGGYIKLPEGSRRLLEWRLRVGEGWSVTGQVDQAVRLVTDVRPALGEVPQVLGLRVHTEVIEVVLASGGDPVVVVDRTRLAPPPQRPILSPPADPMAVAPMLVAVGLSSSGPVMVNLEALGSLLVSGNPAEADAVVRALALELATSFWSGQFAVAVVGFGSELQRFDGIQYFAEVPDLVHALHRRRLIGAEQLRQTGHPSFAHARRVDPSDRWAPMAVLCGPAVSEADVGELLDIAADPVHGTAVVAVGERVDAQHSVRLTGNHGAVSLEPLGAVAFPQRVASDELREITALLDTAASRQSVLRSDEPYVSLPVPLPQPAGEVMAPDREAGREVDVEVAVLGRVEIRGAARPFTRAWAEELVVYLAMHPGGASNEAWATALWPDRLMAPSSLHSTASVARRSLGQRADGVDHLPRSHGRLALSDRVGTDWDRFVALAESDRPEQWHAALTLVRGRPFDGLRSSDWPILEGIAPAIEAAVVDLSGRLAGAYLGQGDAAGAEWAARRGLVVSPYDERLYRMLMRASDLGGNPAGVDAVMGELLTLVADGIEPLDAVHPDTMELYRQLSRRRKFTGPGR